MNRNQFKPPMSSEQKTKLKKKIHRTLVAARKALHEGDEVTARALIRQMMIEAAPAALLASKENSYNWVVEELRALDELMLPDG